MWTTPAPFGNIPTVRRNHAAALIGSTMILYGGMDEMGNPLDDLLALNMENMRWFTPRIHKSCTVRPGKRHSLTLIPVYNYGVLKQFNFDIFHVPSIHDDSISRNNSGLYMFGGITKSGKASNDLFVLKPKKIDYKDDDYYLKWTQPEVTGVPPEPRYAYCAALRGKYIAFFGGRNNEMHAGGLAVRSIALLNVEIMRWETVIGHGMSPAGRWGACMAAFHTKMVIFGGMRINKYCSGKVVIAETDPQVVKEQEAELKYIQNMRETMGRNAFERVNRAALVGLRSLRSHRETTCSVVTLPPIGRPSDEGFSSH
jgi:hypothetical protein